MRKEDIQLENNMMEIYNLTNLSQCNINSSSPTPALDYTDSTTQGNPLRGLDGYVIYTSIPIAGDLL